MTARSDTDRVTPEQRRDACIHEAGHAVVAWALNLPLEGVDILAVGSDSSVAQFVGRTNVTGTVRLPPGRRPPPERRLEYLRALVAYCVAGQIAECLDRGPCGK